MNQPQKQLQEVTSVKEFFTIGSNRTKQKLENKEIKKVVDNCWGIIKELEDNFENYDENELSLRAGKLSIYNAYIGEYVATLNNAKNHIYGFKKLQESKKRGMITKKLYDEYSKKLKEDSITAKKPIKDDITAAIYEDNLELEQDWMFYQEYLDKLNFLINSINRIITTTGWRINQKGKEHNQTKYYGD